MATYTIDLPYSDPRLNRRFGYRMPRSVLLPPYMMVNQLWVDLADIVDEVLGTDIDDKIDILSNLRNMWTTNPEQEQSISRGEIQEFSDWSRPEREILVKQVNMLGMKLSSAGIVSDDGYHAISRFLGQYWFEKGTARFVDFLAFCLGANLDVKNMWTTDYVSFYEEGDPTIGTPIWEGGPWYPTTHVTLVAKGLLDGLDAPSLVNFFYEIANYNLVLYAMDVTVDLWIVDDPTRPKPYEAQIVSIGLFADNGIPISNYARFPSA